WLLTVGRVGCFLTTNNDGGKLTLPAALTSGSNTSRGPAPLSPSAAPRSRRRPAVRPAPSPSALPPLSAQGLRTLVSPHPAPGTLLQSRLPARCTTLAALARQPTLSRLRPRQRTTPRPEPALSAARAPATRRRARGHAAHAAGRRERDHPAAG